MQLAFTPPLHASFSQPLTIILYPQHAAANYFTCDACNLMLTPAAIIRFSHFNAYHQDPMRGHAAL
jgi:hypothetical protein